MFSTGVFFWQPAAYFSPYRDREARHCGLWLDNHNSHAGASQPWEDESQPGRVSHWGTEQIGGGGGGGGGGMLSHRPGIWDTSSERAEVRGMDTCHLLWSSVKSWLCSAVSSCAKLSSITASPGSSEFRNEAPWLPQVWIAEITCYILLSQRTVSSVLCLSRHIPITSGCFCYWTRYKLEDIWVEAVPRLASLWWTHSWSQENFFSTAFHTYWIEPSNSKNFYMNLSFCF